MELGQSARCPKTQSWSSCTWETAPTHGKTARGASSPAKPALHIPEPLSMTWVQCQRGSESRGAAGLRCLTDARIAMTESITHEGGDYSGQRADVSTCPTVSKLLHQRTFVFPIGVVSALSTHHAAIAVHSHFDLSKTTKRESQCQRVFQLPGRDTVAKTSEVGWMEVGGVRGGPSGGGKPPLPGRVEWTVWTSPSAQASLADCAGGPADHDRRWMRCARGRGGATDCAGSDAGV
jgi:hypothetical protein